MPYQPARRLARLRSTERLETRMRNADMSGADIARQVGVSRQLVSLLRTGRAAGVRVELAENLERALKVKRGWLFDYSTPVTTADTTERAAS